MPVSRGTKKVVGHSGSVRPSMMSRTSSGSSIVQPSEICSAGPRPATKLSREAVTGMPPAVTKWVENPPPGKYSALAAWKVVAFRSAAISSSVISHQGLMTGLPSASFS